MLPFYYSINTYKNIVEIFLICIDYAGVKQSKKVCGAKLLTLHPGQIELTEES